MKYADEQVYQDLRINFTKIYLFDIHPRGSLRNVVRHLLWGITRQTGYAPMSGSLLLKYGRSEVPSESTLLIYFQKIT